jgi:hypothetical protein
MMNVRLIGAAALSLMLATPAMAATSHVGMHHRYSYNSGRVIEPELPVQDALRFGYGTGYRTYHSGYGGLYGDGYYPGNVYDDHNLHAPLYAPFG